MPSDKPPHILNAASNLMGICFVLITALKFSHSDIDTYADEVSFAASFCLLCSCLIAYFAIRDRNRTVRFEQAADVLFILGAILLFVSVLLFGFINHSI